MPTHFFRSNILYHKTYQPIFLDHNQNTYIEREIPLKQKNVLHNKTEQRFRWY